MVKVKKDKKESDVPTIEAVITSAVVAEGPKIAKEAAVQEGEVAALRVQLAEAQEAVAALEAKSAETRDRGDYTHKDQSVTHTKRKCFSGSLHE